ncbi:hypothetical protein GCM10009087_02800 [Sphingomonas oligophenolica]|uniref:SGNH/GDSL hydrolase family protein n=1 Tax=Sphingomonas oligophenolica TaxID=301154 RepID=A0ABU9Y0R0_9SPHN
MKRAAAIVDALLFCAGAALIAPAAAANRAWLDRHVLPHMFLSRDQQLLWWWLERGAALVAGLALIALVRPRVVRAVAQGKGPALAAWCLGAGAAVLLSLGASELILRATWWRGIDHWAATEEPLRRADARLGWTLVPGRTGRELYRGRPILYHIDAGSHRVGDPARPVDAARPAILFTGESIMLGFRLNWRETIAGQVEALTGVQAANLAVNGYGTDQAFLRLHAELPRFAQPVAVVALFAPSLLERNLDDDRPHLDAALRWHDGRRYWRLQRLMKNVALYRSSAAIDRGIAATRAVLAETVRAARARHAAVLILVPCFAPEQPTERVIRRRVLDEAGLPYVQVMLDPAWRIAGDRHPDARADLAMARAIVVALRRQRPDPLAGR